MLEHFAGTSVHGGRTKQNPARNLQDRLSRHKWQVLVFLHDFAVPYDKGHDSLPWLPFV